MNRWLPRCKDCGNDAFYGELCSECREKRLFRVVNGPPDVHARECKTLHEQRSKHWSAGKAEKQDTDDAR